MCLNFYIGLSILFILIFFNSCTPSHENSLVKLKKTEVLSLQKEIPTKHDTSALERMFIKKGLVNINSLDSTIRVVLHYSTTQNFLKKPLYKGLTDCYLPCDVAIKLFNAQCFLHEQFPNYHLIVFDAVRPLHIQKQMWDELDMPSKEKINYLAHPDDISLHNYGAAVDVGIIGSNDVLLEMGTPFDFFGELSAPKREQEFLMNGKLSKEALTNRLLLRSIMLKAGFMTIATEWWHFNSTTKIIAAEKYQLIE